MLSNIACLFVGAAFGMFLMALMFAAGSSRREKWRRIEEKHFTGGE